MNVIEKVTAYPSRYALQPEEWESEEIYAREAEKWRDYAEGKYRLRAEGYQRGNADKYAGAGERRDAALVVSEVLGKNAEYYRKEDFYGIGDWLITAHSITSGIFAIGNRGEILHVFAELNRAGYRAEDGLSIYYQSRTAGKKETLTLAVLAERELKNLGKKIGLTEEAMVSVEREGFQLYIPEEKLEYEKLDLYLRLYHKMLRAAGIR